MDKYSRMPDAMPEKGEGMMDEQAEGGPEIEIPVEEIEGSEAWKDGEVYQVSLSLRQVGRGKYEILSAEEESSEEDAGEEGEE